MTDDFGHWFAGFADGESCFEVRFTDAAKRCVPRFTITLRIDDRPILEEIQTTLGIGYVGAKTVKDRNDQATYEVSTRAGCARLVEILDRYPLRARKAQDYAVWRLAVREWITGPSYGRDWTTMRGYRKQIREVRHFEGREMHG